MKIRAILFLAVLIPVYSFGQNIIIKQDVLADQEESNYGPNKKYYKSTFTGLGLLFGKPDATGSAINGYKSFYYESGSRKKRQMGSFFAIGRDLSLNFRSFSIKQNDSKTFGGIAQHKAERLFNINGNLLIYTRYNFKPKRGNQLGKYLDLAGYVEYAMITRHVVTDKLDEALGGNTIKSYYRGLPYLNKWNYGVTARLGFRHMLLFCQYRFSDMFNRSPQFPYQELPRFCAGICFDVPDEFSRDR
ncbi:MAG TPA: hypothetical protein PK637_00200 [Flavobacteriales bacterium]|nr:hypothetical protein [Flavobacteriales bacterium]HRE95151.1 hypothetical protein [Flavobacteriales bacterium]HRJ35717.1 hypothetical protein [Flavobacteriales bacterium]HRJ39433.1 hypothetical protein [Flavobacteriales bacterium]